MSEEKENFFTYKWTILIIYPLVGACIFLSVYTVLVFEPLQVIKEASQQKLIDSMTCPELGQYIINNAKNYSSDYDYVIRNYHYAEAKYLVCTHGGTNK